MCAHMQWGVWSTARAGTLPRLRTVFGDVTTPSSVAAWEGALDTLTATALGLCAGAGPAACGRICQPGSVEDRYLQGLGWVRPAHLTLLGSHRPPPP